MAIKFYNPTTPGRRDMSTIDYSGLSKVAPERSLLEPMKKHSGRNSYGRITVRHRGGGNRTNAVKSAFLLRLNPSSTTPTVPLTSLLFSMKTARRDTLLLLTDSRSATRLFPVRKQTSSQATLFPLPTSPLVPSSTTLSFTPEKAHSLLVPQALWHSLWRKRTSTRLYVFPAASFATFPANATQLSVR